MKKIKSYFTLLLIFCFSQKAITQGNVFQNNYLVAGYTIGDNRLTLPSYKENGEYEGNPYFSKDWVKGAVSTTDKQEFSKNLVFMYDKVERDLYFKNPDSAIIMKADKNRIYSFTLITDRPHVFIRGDLFSKDYTNMFFEVLVLDLEKYTFLKHTTSSFQEPQLSKAAQAIGGSVSHGSFVDKTTYYLFSKGVLEPVDLKKKSFIKAMDINADKTEAYIQKNNGNFNESYVINMLDDINADIQ